MAGETARHLEEIVAAGHEVGVVVRIVRQLGMPPVIKPGPFLGEHATGRVRLSKWYHTAHGDHTMRWPAARSFRQKSTSL